MEDITPLIPQGKQVIDGYGDGGFTVSDVRHEGAVIILPDSLIPWNVTEFAALDEVAFTDVFAHHQEIDVLLIGCGERQQFLPRPLEATLRAAGIIPEVMSTGAACRTYNVLLTEGRNVAAALLPV